MPAHAPSSLTLAQAEAICSGAFAHGAEKGFAPLAVVVLDAGSNVVLAKRQDGCGAARLAVAEAKGTGAAGMGMPSAMMAKSFAQNPGFVASISAATNGRFAAQPGGALILDGDTMIGAVGISGDTGDNDDEAAVAGITAAGLTAQGAA